METFFKNIAFSCVFTDEDTEADRTKLSHAMQRKLDCSYYEIIKNMSNILNRWWVETCLDSLFVLAEFGCLF